MDIDELQALDLHSLTPPELRSLADILVTWQCDAEEEGDAVAEAIILRKRREIHAIETAGDRSP